MDANQIKALVQEQKVFFATNATRSIMFRKQMLAKLKTAIRQNESRIIAALYADLNKSRAEAYMSEIGLVYQALTYMEKHIDQLSAPEKVRTPLFLFKAKSEIRHDPYGCVLVVSPWNYPFLLTMQPLIEAMAAGNTVILKPSDYSAHTTAVIARLIEETFAPAYVAVVTGGRQENEALFHQPFDYIFFTGSPAVGKLCMQAASEHLVPVTLELGGKSPAIVDESANIALAARRIVFGKFLNAGQTCVACDHVYVHESKMPALIHHPPAFGARRHARVDWQDHQRKAFRTRTRVFERRKSRLGRPCGRGDTQNRADDLAAKRRNARHGRGNLRTGPARFAVREFRNTVPAAGAKAASARLLLVFPQRRPHSLREGKHAVWRRVHQQLRAPSFQ